MILKEILDYFEISVDLPDYLYKQNFSDVFLKGKLTTVENTYKIVIVTQKDVTHTMLISPDDDYHLTVTSLLPNNSENGIKFGKTKDELKYI